MSHNVNKNVDIKFSAHGLITIIWYTKYKKIGVTEISKSKMNRQYSDQKHKTLHWKLKIEEKERD